MPVSIILQAYEGTQWTDSENVNLHCFLFRTVKTTSPDRYIVLLHKIYFTHQKHAAIANMKNYPDIMGIVHKFGADALR